ncbi:MAG: hypothetical protein M3020_28520 [Myxococcota bacterium]|nr:hypothetical protein [Myxococcota bacterium]
MNRSRRALAQIVAGVVAAGAFYLLIWETPEELVRARLSELAAALPRDAQTTEMAWRSRLAKAVETGTTPTVRLVVPELGAVEGRESLLEYAFQTTGTLHVEVDPVSVHVKEQRARARLTLTLIQRLPGSERREQRSATAELVRDGKLFRLQTLEVERAGREQPEARP